MTKLVVRLVVLQGSLAILLACAACKKDEVQNAGGPPGGPTGPGPRKGGGGPSPLREIMFKVGKGPQSLSSVIGEELKADQPPWETIQSQTKEYVQLAAAMAKYDPPKGNKESWTKMTTSFSDKTVNLDKAAHASDKSAALAAQKQLAGSCMECHREHRMGPGK